MNFLSGWELDLETAQLVRQQFLEGKGFCQIIVGTGIQPGDALANRAALVEAMIALRSWNRIDWARAFV